MYVQTFQKTWVHHSRDFKAKQVQKQKNHPAPYHLNMRYFGQEKKGDFWISPR